MPRRATKPISPSGLRSFFQRLVFPGFTSLGIADREVVEYVVDLLVSFARTDQLYRIRDLRGQPLETIAEMLVELGRQRQPERRWSFDREMDIRRHVGDYALFTTGLFRTWVERQGLGDYYLEQGRRAYGAAAELAQLGFRVASAALRCPRGAVRAFVWRARLRAQGLYAARTTRWLRTGR